LKPRAAVILIQDDRIAMIDRHRSGRHYIVFPGGKIEANETAEAAAVREAWEELGLEVTIGKMVAEVWYRDTPQYYYLAVATGGRFGSGTGHEMHNKPGSKKGTYLPIWMPLDEILHQPVLPKLMAEFVFQSQRTRWPEKPLVVKDQSPEQPG